MADTHHVVVDGSNLATEGRTLPSLAQLDEAVRAYVEEDPGAEIIVVVDASFEHRIDVSEREQLEQAELHGEVVSPPAGAIGRGDAFVLRIAERTGAIVLSNDSFQEFHGEHPWLFEEGRLIGGKPVPGIGWIFTPRIPVRGPKSREATSRASRSQAASMPAPVKAAELAKAAKRVAKAAKKAARHPDGSVPRIGDVWVASPVPALNAVPAAPEPEGNVAAEALPTLSAATSEGETTKRAAKKAPKRASKAAAKKAPEPEPVKAASSRSRAAVLDVGPDSADDKAGQATVGADPEPETTGLLPSKAATKAAKKAATKAAKKAATKAAKKAVTKTAKKVAPAKSAAVPAAKVAKKAPAAKAARAVKKATKKASTAPARTDPPPEGADPAPVPGETAAGETAAGETAMVATTQPAAVEPTRQPSVATAKKPAGAKRPAPVADHRVRAAIAEATAEAIDPPELVHAHGPSKTKGMGGKGAKRSKRRTNTASPPPAVNEPLTFIMFVATYPVGSTVEGVVASYTSHGAMVDVELPEGGSLHCYVPLSGLGDPPPTKAREVLTRGERRPFVLVGLDPPRRVAELSLGGTPTASAAS